jgi:hypothetical protein
LVDLNEDTRPLIHEIVDRDLHLTQVRLPLVSLTLMPTSWAAQYSKPTTMS